MSFLDLEASGHQSDYSDSDESGCSSSTSGKKNGLRGKSLVQHNYHDHANVVCNSNMFVTRGGIATVFPVKLFRMLLNTEADGQTDIVGWQPHGRSFAVRKPKEFAEQILPKFFGKMKYPSFQRQLNLYGFLRLSRGQDKGSYYHELFLRHRDFLCYKLQRTRIKGTGARAASNPSAEPDFYGMPPVAEHVAEQQQVAPEVPAAQELEPVDIASSSDSSSEDEVDAADFLREFLLDDVDCSAPSSLHDSISSLCSEDEEEEGLPEPAAMVTVAPQQFQPQLFPSKLPQLDTDEIGFLQSLFGAKDVEKESSLACAFGGNANNAVLAFHNQHAASGSRRPQRTARTLSATAA